MYIKTFLFFFFVAIGGASIAAAEPPTSAPQPRQSHLPADKEPETLADAYEREFAFLDTQRRELQRLLQELQQGNRQQETRLEGRIERVQRQILDLSLQAKRLEETILDAEKQQEALQENAALLEMTLTQAQTSLKDSGVEVGNLEGSDADQLMHLFTLARQALDAGSGLNQRDGSFFLADGREVQGNLIFLGNIAAYGLSDAGGGILIPAGEGHLKLMDKSGGEEIAQALSTGKSPSTLKLFLFESMNKAIDLEEEHSWKETLDNGGPIAWIIAALGVIGLVLAMVRTAILTRANWGGSRLLRSVLSQTEQGNKTDALQLLEKSSGAYREVIHASLTHLDLPQEEWEIAVSDALLQQSVKLDRFGSLILVAAAVAPLLGLLGTVTGMIATFDVITRFGTGDPKLLATGIAIALITTQVGLIVAIPLLLLGNVLNGWSKSIKDSLEMAALEIREADKERNVSFNANAKDQVGDVPAPRFAFS